MTHVEEKSLENVAITLFELLFTRDGVFIFKSLKN